MKKIKILLMFLLLFLFCGCYREESIMTINKDKSIDFEIKVLVEDNFNESKYVNNSEKYDEREIKIRSINEYGHKGYKFIKHYESIDDISSSKDVSLELTEYVNPDFDDSVMFKVKKGYFRNKYTANFSVNKEFISKNLKAEKKETITEFLSKVKDIYNKTLAEYKKLKLKEEIEYTNENLNLDGYDGIKYCLKIDQSGNIIFFEVNDLVYKYEIESENILVDSINDSNITELEIDPNSVVTFVLNLPRKSIRNNANKLSRDGKSLTWYYDENSSENTIEFSFYLYNRSNILKLFGLVILIFGGIPLVFWGYKKIISREKEKFEDENPIYSDYDESIKGIALKGRRKIKTINIKKKKGYRKKKELLNIIELDSKE